MNELQQDQSPDTRTTIMNEQIRKAFEEEFPRRANVQWSAQERRYAAASGDTASAIAAREYQFGFDAWQAAHARYAGSGDDAIADHQRLVRELDVLINGESGAAQQASLCDIVAQVKKQGLVVGYAGGGEAVSDADILSAARKIGLRQMMHGISATAAVVVLREFLSSARPPSQPKVPEIEQLIVCAQGWREYDCDEASTEERILYGACRAIRDAMLSAQENNK